MTSKKISKKNIKYNIKNTPLPVIITHDGIVYVDVNSADTKKLKKNNKKCVEKYRKLMEQTMEYLFLEGFCTESAIK